MTEWTHRSGFVLRPAPHVAEHGAMAALPCPGCGATMRVTSRTGVGGLDSERHGERLKQCPDCRRPWLVWLSVADREAWLRPDPQMAPLFEAAAELRRLQETVHLRHACPSCEAAAGRRCRSLRLPFDRSHELQHPHAARVRLEVPDR